MLGEHGPDSVSRSGWRRMGAVMNADFRSSNASWVLVFQDKDLGLVKTSKGQYVG